MGVASRLTADFVEIREGQVVLYCTVQQVRKSKSMQEVKTGTITLENMFFVCREE